MADVQENSRMKRFNNILSNFCLENLKVILLSEGVILGLIIGFSLTLVDINANDRDYIGYLGDILLHALKSVAVPVISGSIVSTVGFLHLRTYGRISIRILIYLLLGKCCAAVLCIPLCLIVRPGETSHIIYENETDTFVSHTPSRRVVDRYLDIGRNLLPENWIDMFIAHYETQIINQTDPHSTDFSVDLVGGTNLLGILLISTLLGVGLSILGEEGTPLTEAFNCIAKVCMIVSNWFTWLAPIGLFFIICRDIVNAPISFDSLKILGQYAAILWSCCIIQLILVHPIIYFIFTRKNPVKIFLNCPESLIISFVTGSSTGTIPIAIKELVKNQNLDERIVKIVLPIGVTVNKDGAFYMYVISCIFEAQRTGKVMGVDLIILVLVLALTMSMVTASIRHQGMALLIVMWETLDLQYVEKDIALFFMVEYLSDRMRTVLHVFSNIFCASVLDNFKLLEDEDQTA